MNFSYYDFGYLEKGKIVEVQLSAAANVRLMDSTNYSNYKNGRKHRYYGGYVTRSPYRITVPSAGHWYLTIDLGGYSGTVRHMLTGKLKHPFSKVSHYPMGLLQSISPIWGAKVHYLNVFLKMS